MDVIVAALAEMTEPLRLVMLLVGVCTGLVIGVIPGLGGLFGMALLIPLTFGLDPYSAIALLLGMSSVTTTSDTIPAVLIGVPGTVGAMATVVDGHALAKQNQAGRALGAAYSASLLGGLFGAFILAVSLPLLKPLVLMLRTPDFLAITLLGLSLVALLVGRDPLKGFAAAGAGVVLSFVGVDDQTAAHRWTFGQIYLWEGLPLGALFLGLFGVPEVASMMSRKAIAEPGAAVTTGVRDGIANTLREWRLVLQCSSIGALLGALPGVGLSVVSWIAYGFARRNRGDGPEFGEGNIRGVIGPESANNANDGGSLIPTIALGIPGGAGTALLLGALIVHGVVPGPHMLEANAAVTVAMIFSLAMANVIGAGICLALSNPLSRIATVSSHIIGPIALVFVILGAFQSSASVNDVVVLLCFGVVGMVMKARDWPRPALALGFVLGELVERNFFLSWQIFGWSTFLRPSFLLVALLLAVQIGWRLAGWKRRGGNAVPAAASVWSSVAVFVFGGCVLLTAQALPAAAALFPSITAVFLLSVAVLMLFRALVPAKGGGIPVTGSSPARDPVLTRAGAAVVMGIPAFLAGLLLVGPLLSSGLLVAATMRRGGESVVRSVSTGALVALVVHLVFDRLISTPWPRSLLEKALSAFA